MTMVVIYWDLRRNVVVFLYFSLFIEDCREGGDYATAATELFIKILRSKICAASGRTPFVVLFLV
jgi:hypothetical protein